MIRIRADGRLIAVDQDDLRAEYPSSERLRVTRPSDTDHWAVGSVRALIEVQRQHGGLAPRAVLGGEFTADEGQETVYEVLAGHEFDVLSAASVNDTPGSCLPSRLNHHWPFAVGLPKEFAHAVLDGLTENSCRVGFPPGVLIVDRAGFDEQESSTVVFELAARMLRCVLAAKLQDGDVEAEVRILIHSW